jgi:hypothetical protein
MVDKQLAKEIAKTLLAYHLDPDSQHTWPDFGSVVDQLTHPIQISPPQRENLAAKLAAEFMRVPLEDLESVLKFGFSFWILQSKQGPFRVEKVTHDGRPSL